MSEVRCDWAVTDVQNQFYLTENAKICVVTQVRGGLYLWIGYHTTPTYNSVIKKGEDYETI